MAAVADALLRRHVVVQRLSAAEVRKVDALLRRLDSTLRDRLGGEELTTLARSRLQRTLERVDSYMSDQFGSYRKEVLGDLLRIANGEAHGTAKALEVTVDQNFDVPSAAQIRAAALNTPLSVTGADGGKLLGTFLADWTAKEATSVTNAIRLGVTQGLTNAQIVKGIRGTAALNYNDGLLSISKRNADKIVHTAVQHVASMARQALFDENDDVVDGVQWLSTLDSATCPACGALDGEEFDADSGPRPPLHIFCRCTTLPRLKGEFAKLSRGRIRPAVGDDGAEQISGSTNYFSWLRTQPASFQNFALGPTRGKLLRDGGLSASRFAQLQLSKNFMPLTISDAEALDPIAFAKAGLTE
jgi:SPP1 gp7 family putative phage head morphogenesis protein